MKDEYQTALAIISSILFITILIIIQLIGLLTSNDFLILLSFTRTSSSIGIWVVPIGIIITYIIYLLLKRTIYFDKMIYLINRLLKEIKKYPIIYRILKFVYKHPILTGLLLGIFIALVEYVVYFFS